MMAFIIGIILVLYGCYFLEVELLTQFKYLTVNWNLTYDMRQFTCI